MMRGIRGRLETIDGGGERTSEAAPEAVGQAVGGGYCRLQMPLQLALAVRETVTGSELGALEGGGGGYLPPFECIPGERCPMDRAGRGPFCWRMANGNRAGTGRTVKVPRKDRAFTDWALTGPLMRHQLRTPIYFFGGAFDEECFFRTECNEGK